MNEAIDDMASVKTTVNAEYIKSVFGALKEVRDEGKIKFTEDGVFSQVASPANVIMAVCKVKGQALNGITIKGGEEVVIGSKFEDMHDNLGAFKNSSDIQFQYPHTVGSSHAVRLHSPDEGMELNITVLDKDTVPDMSTVSPLSHKRRIVIDGSDLKKAITNADRFTSDSSNSVEMGTEDDVFYIETSDNAKGSMRKEFYQSGPSGDDSLGNVETSIGHPMLEDIKGVVGSSNNVTVHIADSKPVRIDVDLDENGDAQIIYIIAPRLESE